MIRIFFIILLLPLILLGQSLDSIYSKNLINYSFQITAAEIKYFSPRKFNEILNRYSGLVFQNGQFHLRGSRGDEIGYYLNKTYINDPLSNNNSLYFIPEAIDKIIIYPGNIPIEFPYGLAGIINTDLKRGTDHHLMSFKIRTDKFLNAHEKILNTYSYQDHIFTAIFSGPIAKNINYFVAIENKGIGDNIKRFNAGFSFTNLVDTHWNTANIDADTISNLSYPGGMALKNSMNQWAVNSAIHYFSDLYNVQMNFIYTHSNIYDDRTPILNLLNNRQQHSKNQNIFISGIYNHELQKNLSLELSLHYSQFRSESYDDYFGNDWLSWADSSKIAQYTNNRVQYRKNGFPHYNYILNGFPFSRDGTLNSYFEKSEQQNYGFQTQLHYEPWQNKRLTIGLNFYKYKLRKFSINPSVISLIDNYDGMKNVPEDNWSTYVENYYGYNLYGDEIEDGFDAPRKPHFFSTFTQFDFKLKSFYILLGLTYSSFYLDDYYLRDPANPKIDFDTNLIIGNEWNKNNAHKYLNPNFGITYTSSEDLKIGFSAGKYTQAPKLSSIYFGEQKINFRIVRGGFFDQNPFGFNVKPLESSKFDFSVYTTLFKKSIYANVSFFYKNMKNQFHVIRQNVLPESSIQTYFYISNSSQSESRGFELNLFSRRINSFQTRLSYTFLKSQGTACSDLDFYNSIYRTGEKSEEFSPLDYGVNHQGIFSFDYRLFENTSLSIFNNFGIGFVYKLTSGHPFTLIESSSGSYLYYNTAVYYFVDPRHKKEIENHNSSTTDWIHSLDFFLDKSFIIMKNLSIKFYIQIYNLLNTKNEINVFEQTGDATDDGHVSDPARISNYDELYIEMYRKININNGQGFWDYSGNQLYNNPRQIFIGFEISY